MPGKVRVLVVDDSTTVRHRLVEILRAVPDFEVVGEAEDGKQAIELCLQARPDVITKDMMMPVMSGLAATEYIMAHCPTPIAVVSASVNRGELFKIYEALSAGAVDVLEKPTAAQTDGDWERRFIATVKMVAKIRVISYAVAHDLRAPLRSIDGFGLALLEDYADKLDDDGKQYLTYVRESAQQMSQLIDDMLALAQVTRGEFERTSADLSAIARKVGAQLARAAPKRQVDLKVADGLVADADARLMTIAFENLLGNAWKYTGGRERAHIEVGALEDDARTFYVRDNGAGFDMAYADKLFGMFQRLHAKSEFEGTGVGLATVHRVIRRHGGRIWADAAVGKGAVFFFRLDDDRRQAGTGQPSNRESPLALKGAA